MPPEVLESTATQSGLVADQPVRAVKGLLWVMPLQADADDDTGHDLAAEIDILDLVEALYLPDAPDPVIDEDDDL